LFDNVSLLQKVRTCQAGLWIADQPIAERRPPSGSAARPAQVPIWVRKDPSSLLTAPQAEILGSFPLVGRPAKAPLSEPQPAVPGTTKRRAISARTVHAPLVRKGKQPMFSQRVPFGFIVKRRALLPFLQMQ